MVRRGACYLNKQKMHELAQISWCSFKKPISSRQLVKYCQCHFASHPGMHYTLTLRIDRSTGCQLNFKWSLNISHLEEIWCYR